jgi:uncharacterized damage-inducible protein DinB
MTATQTQPLGSDLDSRERQDLLQTLDKHRGFLRYTVRNITDAQANQRTTISALTLAALIKHVANVEEGWTRFIVEGPAAMGAASAEDWENAWKVLPEETLAVLLRRYEEVARRTADLVRELPSLDADQPLPAAPWFEPGARWSARRVLLHILAETAQHAGHADIIREALDGQKTMG